LDPYPLRLLCDPDATLIRAVGTENEGHWAGLIAAPVTYVVNPEGHSTPLADRNYGPALV
jgi:peroxiredoxin